MSEPYEDPYPEHAPITIPRSGYRCYEGVTYLFDDRTGDLLRLPIDRSEAVYRALSVFTCGAVLGGMVVFLLMLRMVRP